MVDNDFLEYIENAFVQYDEYHAIEGVKKLEFRDFLMMIVVWKMEEILERLEDTRK